MFGRCLDTEVEVEPNGNLAGEISFEGNSVKVTQHLDKGVDGYMRASELCDTEELKGSDADGSCWGIWGTWH